jgi:hypothetical protein
MCRAADLDDVGVAARLTMVDVARIAPVDGPTGNPTRMRATVSPSCGFVNRQRTR